MTSTALRLGSCDPPRTIPSLSPSMSSDKQLGAAELGAAPPGTWSGKVSPQEAVGHTPSSPGATAPGSRAGSLQGRSCELSAPTGHREAPSPPLPDNTQVRHTHDLCPGPGNTEGPAETEDIGPHSAPLFPHPASRAQAPAPSCPPGRFRQAPRKKARPHPQWWSTLAGGPSAFPQAHAGCPCPGG